MLPSRTMPHSSIGASVRSVKRLRAAVRRTWPEFELPLSRLIPAPARPGWHSQPDSPSSRLAIGLGTERMGHGCTIVAGHRTILRNLQLRFACPCSGQMAVSPTKGTCTFAMAFQIERGSYGSVSLDGLGFIIRADA